MLLTPVNEGTNIELALSKKDIRALLEDGFSIGDVVIRKTEPKNVQQLLMFNVNE